MTRRFARPVAATPPLAGGFTFLEILLVMALAGVLLGLGVGFLMGVGQTAMGEQAVAILAESGQRCLNASVGVRRAVLELRAVRDADDNERLEVTTSVRRTVLTANFEAPEFSRGAPGTAPADGRDQAWFVGAGGPGVARASPGVTVEPEGHAGSAASIAQGGFMDFGDRSIYAMTHGLEVDCRLRPSPAGRAVMTVVKSGAGGGASGTVWAVQLLRDAGAAEGWRVTLKVAAVAADAPPGAPSAGLTEWRTKDAPVLPGVWSHLHVSWDGREPSILVDGVERWERPSIPAGATAPVDRGPMRLAQDSAGTATLALSDPSSSFTGLVDTLTVAGVFRSDEDVRLLPTGVVPLRTALPVRLVFSNGRLDPDVHRESVEVRLQASGDSDDMWRWVRFGLYGGVEVGQGIQQPAGRLP